MTLKVGLEGMSITLRGSFNPSIVHPQWLADNKLIRDQEAADALERSQTDSSTFVVSPEVTVFSVGVFGFIVERDKFQLETQDMASAEPLRDLAAALLGILTHTPVKALLFGRNIHFGMASEEEWHRVGHHLVPKEPWADILDNPGTKTVRVVGARKGADSRVEFVVEPSKLVKQGVFVGFGELFTLNVADGAADAVAILKDHWSDSQRYARSSAEQIVQRCLS